jgi:hypothetical protein
MNSPGLLPSRSADFAMRKAVARDITFEEIQRIKTALLRRGRTNRGFGAEEASVIAALLETLSSMIEEERLDGGLAVSTLWLVFNEIFDEATSSSNDGHPA